VADFDPRQLDQLEDALERLDEDREDLESLELPPEVLARLAEYQDVLALCRDAFPPETPRDDVLTVVLDEAREVSRRPRSRDDNRRSGWRRFWERWRGTMVPGLALATTAAVVLWVFDPSRGVDMATELSSEKLDDRPSQVELERTQPTAESSNQTRNEEPSDEPSAEPPEPTPSVDVEPPEPAVDKTQQIEPKIPGSKVKKAAGGVAPEPEPAPQPMNKDETWTSLERADSARRTGNCDKARKIYDEVIAASSDVQAIAQAKGGIGLCFEQDRRDSEASKWFEQARSASPGIDAWIDRQRDEQPLPGEAKKPRSKKDALFEDDANSL
jgi:hypothetical protein